VVVAGHGASFSAGADMQWMRGMAAASEADNREDSLALARLMRTLDELPKPTLARVHGAAFGGGVGLVACCDIAIASTSARFGLTESRLGLLPAVISPYVIEAIGPRQARRWFATGEHFDADTALRIGLVHQLVEPERLDEACSASWPCSTRPARSPRPPPSSWCGRSVTAMTATPWIAIMPP
jgi:methylglutaconyl-CoA hydratase